ncbi:TPA: hypothetical protein JG926_001706 [Enterobacter hormaechei subsp. steigerwaltii]|nr:hypothetical protein [Enterobacter hormaechei subsp. steigerwaltii]
MMKRGIVTPPGSFRFNTDRAALDLQGFSTDEVHYYALYWDELVVLDSSNISLSIPKQDELLAAGILKRPKMFTKGMLDISQFSHLYANFQIEVLKDLRAKEKSTDWLLHQVGDEFNFGVYSSGKDILRLELLKALPVPNKDLHIEEILEFKQKYKDDLNALHSYIAELYYDVLKSPDVELSKREAYDRLDKQIKSINKLCLEKWKYFPRFDVSVNCEFDAGQVIEFLTKVSLSITGSQTLNMGVVGDIGGLAISAASTMVKIKHVKSGLLKGEKEKLAFLTSASKKGIY